MEQESTTLKLCKECKHSKRDWVLGWEYAKCGAAQASGIDLVAGKTLYTSYCSVQRNHSSCCGKDAKFFEEKKKGWW